DFWTGLRIQRITQSIAKYYNLSDTKGVIITQVENGSPAHSAGLEVGDIIRKVDNYRIQDDNTMVDLLNNYQTNDVIALEIQREDKTLIKNLKLERRK
ncbi:MAG: PDZ domain-containing protein, partial [Melioribacteraceae bacterium]|nr:PDZ domain-containing protein [Melioribacteraceae bacterium]